MATQEKKKKKKLAIIKTSKGINKTLMSSSTYLDKDDGLKKKKAIRVELKNMKKLKKRFSIPIQFLSLPQ